MVKAQLLVLSIIIFCGRGTLCAEVKIASAEGLTELSKNVSSGWSYSGTTLFLDADIYFSGNYSEQFVPIGKDWSHRFQGTFNGQGHIISNLVMNSSSQYVGLFGYSERATIRNAVLDSSCSTVSSYNGDYAYVGGVAGYCDGCTVESIVNMANTLFTGNTSTWNSLYLGGIVGSLYASNNEATVKNCANYGSVTHHGTARYAYIGGIVGCSGGDLFSDKIYI